MTTSYLCAFLFFFVDKDALQTAVVKLELSSGLLSHVTRRRQTPQVWEGFFSLWQHRTQTILFFLTCWTNDTAHCARHYFTSKAWKMCIRGSCAWCFIKLQAGLFLASPGPCWSRRTLSLRKWWRAADKVLHLNRTNSFFYHFFLTHCWEPMLGLMLCLSLIFKPDNTCHIFIPILYPQRQSSPGCWRGGRGW